ncbi:cyanophycin synthetase [Flexibacter flexilis DSM 6793]|uniref:Cyanophycin synthetase n=1 Tax=Flexibacter flexilis DSM 6793 TaxID=927664 RepID=A0A1I1MZN7_9BACT|nr:cyanophycin synthetase [Flexibacter flexilis]SFC90871.1 cyanophycin synthetase [Flexibacter flexilis DSM 6793]
MKILDIRAMRGPNYWSVRRHKLIVMKLDLEELEERPTNHIEGFREKLEQLLPTLYEHRCSEGCSGGFFKRVEEGTWMGHVIEHIALEIQTLAGMDVGFGRTRSTGQYGVYHVVFAYMEEKAGVYAARASVRIAEALVKSEPYLDLEKDLQTMREIREDERLGPSTGSIVDEAVARDIPFLRLNRHSLVQLGYGIRQQRIQATVTGQTSNIAVEIACDKEETKNLLEAASIPVASGDIVYDIDDLHSVVNRVGFPLVAKPVNGNHGRGATINIKTWEEAEKALEVAQRISSGVIFERFITGHDYRLLVIDHKFTAAAKRTPAAVVGDGKSTVQQLVDVVNSDPRRGYGHEKVLTAIKIDQSSLDILKEKGLTLDSVLPEGEELYLKATANLSTGGTSTDVTDLVHPYNVFMAERISRIIGLDICGIDVMTHDISIPLNESGGAVLEVNAAPGFRMHIAPTSGLPRNVAEPVLDMLYPPGSNARIPIIAVSGTNGKTTTTRLIAHIVKTTGIKVGFTTTDGIYIHNQMVEKGDCTGPVSAAFVLKDPTVEFAVLECARGGIIRAGLGFDKSDIGIVTNVAADHLGLHDINTVEEMARVKGVVVESVKKDGYAILNADDDLVYNMGKSVSSKIALFSMDETNPRIIEHCQAGGYAAIAENGYITVCKGTWKIRIAKIVNIPLTFAGKAIFMIQNILPAVLAGFLSNFKTEDIRVALETFIPSPTQTPGRMNMFKFNRLTVMIDYAHNPAGLQALGRFLERIEDAPKIGILTGVGDRRNEDIMELGVLAGEIFDEVIIRQDKNLRGRQDNEIVELLEAGIRQSRPSMKITNIPDEVAAVEFAVTTAPTGAFIVVCSDAISEVVEAVLRLREQEAVVQITQADIPNR